MITMQKLITTTINTAVLNVSLEDIAKSGYLNLGQGHDQYSQNKSLYATTYINAQGGNDNVVLTGFGNSVVYGGSGDDSVIAGSGTDKLYGGSGSDKLWGEEGNDQLFGNEGGDYLNGGLGNDVLSGGAGHDGLNGGQGSDILYGGDGNDKLEGSIGNDSLTGGAGADTFSFQVGQPGIDYINDFNVGEDKIELEFFWGASPSVQWLFSTGQVWIEQKADGQHVFVDNPLSTVHTEFVVQTTDGSLLTQADFV